MPETHICLTDVWKYGLLGDSAPLPLFVKKWVILTEDFEMLIFDAYI